MGNCLEVFIKVDKINHRLYYLGSIQPIGVCKGGNVMATTSFTKNFKVSGQKSESFVKIMTTRPKKSIDTQFKSKRTSVLDRKDLLRKALT